MDKPLDVVGGFPSGPKMVYSVVPIASAEYSIRSIYDCLLFIATEVGSSGKTRVIVQDIQGT